MENVIEGKKTITDLTDFYMKKIKLAVQESTNGNKRPNTSSRMGLAFGIISNQGGFQLLDMIMPRLISHMIPYKFKCSHWWKINLLSSLNAVNQ